MNRFQVLEVTDTVNACDCCGRNGLKRTVAIQDNESNDVKYFGTTCATKPEKGFNLAENIKQAIEAFEYTERLVNRLTCKEYRKQGGTIANNQSGDSAVIVNQSLYDTVRKQIIEKIKKDSLTIKNDVV